MKRAEAHRFLDQVRAGRVHATPADITLALRATGDMAPRRIFSRGGPVNDLPSQRVQSEPLPAWQPRSAWLQERAL